MEEIQVKPNHDTTASLSSLRVIGSCGSLEGLSSMVAEYFVTKNCVLVDIADGHKLGLVVNTSLKTTVGLWSVRRGRYVFGFIGSINT